MAFNIGLSGLNAAAADLKVTGNNIANVATTGFKQSRAEFGDIFTRSYGTISKTNIGAGVRLVASSQQFTQGTLEFTDNSLDLSITGRGFFVLNGAGNDDNIYTRAGAFQVDNEGYIVNNGAPPLRLQGFPPTDPSDPKSPFITGKRSDMLVNLADSPPNATTDIAAQINLRSDALPPINSANENTEFNTGNPDSYNFSTSTTVYDSLGTPRTVTMYFVRTGDPGDNPGDPGIPSTDPITWKVFTEMDGRTGDPPDQPEGFDITFDTDGNLIPDENSKLELEFDLGNYAPLNGAKIGGLDDAGEYDNIINLDLTGTTQYGQRYAVTSLEQDGYTTGRITGVDSDEEGVLFVRYSNGRALPLGQVALADFDNPQGLQQIGDTSWAETTASGGPVIFSPGTGSLGTIQGGALETSNVDLATELVNLITAQRNYQANSQTISAANTITQTILNIQ